MRSDSRPPATRMSEARIEYPAVSKPAAGRLRP